jgi:hypothetical protein
LIQGLLTVKADETPYFLDDPVGEGKWNFRLEEALERSKKHRSGFLRGHTFFVTKNAQIDKNLLKNIISAHGGEVSHDLLVSTLVKSIKTSKVLHSNN